MSASAAVAEWVAGPGPRELPDPALALVRRALADTVAVTLLGAAMDAPRIVAQVEFDRSMHGAASVFAMRRKTDPIVAALVNGTSAHAALFDDNNAPMIAHPSAPLFSALLPLAQATNATGRAVVESYAAGFEVGVKLGRALNPRLYERGWHVTRTLGVIGAAAACARLLALTPDAIASAIGIAASMAGGFRQNFGTMTMPLHVGLTARDAIHAALLAQRGFRADEEALEGRYGFFRVFAQQAAVLPPLGEPLELLASGIVFKPYPSGAPTQAALDAALALRDQVDPNAIARVTCFVHPWNAMTLRAREPRDPLQAKVSLAFCVAAALVHGRVSSREFTAQALADAKIVDLMRRVETRVSDSLPDSNEFPAEVEIVTRDGRTLRHRSDVPPGGSTRPLSDADVFAKLRDCATGVLDATALERTMQLINRFDTLPRVSPLCELL